MFHGGGGFKHSEVYNMPIWMRNFHTRKISEYNKKQNEEMERAKKGSTPNKSQVHGPNVSPNNTYNF